MTTATTATKLEHWRAIARQLRIDSIRATTAAGSGHPSSALSAADLMAVLLAEHFRYDFGDPASPDNDHLIFSKGHAAPLLYALFRAAGAIDEAELLSLRRAGSRLEGHPAPVLPWVEVATGSLGQGLPIGVGIALAGQRLDRRPYRVWVLLGDSEMSEGSVWEAIAYAGHARLGRLVGILDVNRFGQRGETALGWDTAAYAARARAFGWRAIEVDGHDLAAIDAAYREATARDDAPVLIVARTVKGKGVSLLEDQPGWHGRALAPAQAEEALRELGGIPDRPIVVEVRKPERRPAPTAAPRPLPRPLVRYGVGEAVATRQAYGDALRALGAARPEVVALDAEVGNSTFAERFAQAHPERFFEMYIAEQLMVGCAVGLAVRRYVPFASTFGAFLTRAYDFVRMAAVSRADVRLCGSHAGVSIGEDGPSQMALEDLAMFRAVHGSTVLYPCDANQTAELVAEMADRRGIVYLRTTREKTPVIYPPGEPFPIGGSRVVRRQAGDRAAIVAAGVTLHEALKAHARLAEEGIAVRVIDAYSVKPIDVATLREAARDTGGRLVVVEDHWPEGGLGDAVLEAFAGDGAPPGGPLPAVIKLAVRTMPGSAAPAEQLERAGISARHIVDAVHRLLGR